jgi:asparagine synthase (glutamine-hydrolysing)
VVERLDKLRVMYPDLDPALIYELSMSSWTPWEISSLLGGETSPRGRVETDARSYEDQLAHDDLRHFLPDDVLVKVDRTSMASGLEGREPLLDHRLVEFAMRLPLSMRRGPLGPKHLLRKILYKHVPRELLERPKQGFAIPLATWMRGELAPLVEEYLSPSRIRDAGLLDPDMVAAAVRNFKEGAGGNDRLDTQRLWYLLSFELWRERWMTQTSNRDSEGAPYARAVSH